MIATSSITLKCCHVHLSYSTILAILIIVSGCTPPTPDPQPTYHPLITAEEIRGILLKADEVVITCRDCETESVTLSGDEIKRFGDAFDDAEATSLGGWGLNPACWLQANQDGVGTLHIVLESDKDVIVNAKTVFRMKVNPFLRDDLPILEQFQKIAE